MATGLTPYLPFRMFVKRAVARLLSNPLKSHKIIEVNNEKKICEENLAQFGPVYSLDYGIGCKRRSRW